MSDTMRIAKAASRQHALVTIDDVRQVGMTTSKLEHQVGDLVERVRRGVYRMPGMSPTWEQCALAACLAAGPAAVLSHACGGRIYAVRGFEWPEMIDITVPWPMN